MTAPLPAKLSTKRKKINWWQTFVIFLVIGVTVLSPQSEKYLYLSPKALEFQFIVLKTVDSLKTKTAKHKQHQHKEPRERRGVGPLLVRIPPCQVEHFQDSVWANKTVLEWEGINRDREEIYWANKKRTNQPGACRAGSGAADHEPEASYKHCFWQAAGHGGQGWTPCKTTPRVKIWWGGNRVGGTAAKCITISAEPPRIRVLTSSCRGFLSPRPLMAVVVQRAQQLAALGLTENRHVHTATHAQTTKWLLHVWKCLRERWGHDNYVAKQR